MKCTGYCNTEKKQYDKDEMKNLKKFLKIKTTTQVN